MAALFRIAPCARAAGRLCSMPPHASTQHRPNDGWARRRHSQSNNRSDDSWRRHKRAPNNSNNILPFPRHQGPLQSTPPVDAAQQQKGLLDTLPMRELYKQKQGEEVACLQAKQEAEAARQRAEEEAACAAEAAAVQRLVEVSWREQGASSGQLGGDSDAAAIAAAAVRALLRAGLQEAEVERLIIAGGGGPYLVPVAGEAAIEKLLCCGLSAEQLLQVMLASPRVLAVAGADEAVEALWQLCVANGIGSAEMVVHLLCAAPGAGAQLLHIPRERLEERFARWRRRLQLPFCSDAGAADISDVRKVYDALRRRGGVLDLSLGEFVDKVRLLVGVPEGRQHPMGELDLRDVLPFDVLLDEGETKHGRRDTPEADIAFLIKLLSQPEEEIIKTRNTMLYGLGTLENTLGEASLAEAVARNNIRVLEAGEVPYNLAAMCSYAGGVEAAKRVLRKHSGLLGRDFSSNRMRMRVEFWGWLMAQARGQSSAGPLDPVAVMLACGPLLKSRLHRVAPRALWVLQQHGVRVCGDAFQLFNTSSPGAERRCFHDHFRLRFDREDAAAYREFRRAWLASEQGRAWCKHERYR